MTSLRWLPPLAWTALIAWFSWGSWSVSETGPLLLPFLRRVLPWAAPEQIEAAHWLIRKVGHVLEYAVLAGLWWRALAPRGAPGGRVALGLSVLTAALDEAYQSTTSTRTGSVADVILDAGAAAAALLALASGGAASDRLVGALLWTAAAGGATLIVIGWAATVPSGWLWLSVPTAWIALFAWRRRRSRA